MSKKKVEVKEKKEVKSTKKKVTIKAEKESKPAKKKETIKEEKKVKEVIAKPRKEVVKETKKVTKKTKEKGTLNAKAQKRLKILSHIVSIIAKILKVCAMIVVPIIAIVALIIPIVLGRVEINGNIVKFDDLRIVMHNDYITANIGDKTYTIADNVKNIDNIINFLNSNTLEKLLIILELTLIFSVITLIISIYLLKYAEKLFDNFYRGSTPFTTENTNYILKIGQVMFYGLVASIIFNIVLSIAAKDTFDIHLGSYSIIGIAIVFIAYYIFEYATKLQDKSKDVIYD